MEQKIFDRLPPEAAEIRRAIFMEEQGYTYEEEFDDRDAHCVHLVLYDKGEAMATCRFFPGESEGENVYIIGRVCVMKSFRSRGLGAEAVKGAEGEILRRGGTEVRLHAQDNAVGFYEKMGYTVCSEMDYEGPIAHFWMRKKLK